MKAFVVSCIFALLMAGSACAAAGRTGPDVALVPLDNRPACLDYTVRIGEVAGVSLRVPPFSAIGAYSFTGDPESVGKWLLELEPAPDFLIVSIDMLAYGGLVASRTAGETLDAAAASLDVLSRFRRKNPGTVILAFGVIQRIARTATGNAGYDRVTSMISDYVKKADQAEAENNLIIAAEAESLKKKIPPEQLDKYLAARRRNHEINIRTIELAAGGVLDFLMIGMDDNAVYGPQRPERKGLEKLVEDRGVSGRVIIIPGADEAAHLLMARAINIYGGSPPRVAVRYYPDDAGEWTPDLEDRPLARHVEQALEIAGFRKGAWGDADAALLLYGNHAGGAAPEREWAAGLAGDAAALLNEGRVAGVADVRLVNQSDPGLVGALLEKNEAPRLAAYSGWNTAGNALGTCVGHLAAANAMRRLAGEGAPGEERRAKAHISFLLQRFLDDYVYMAKVRPEITTGLLLKGMSPNSISGRAYPEFSRSLKSKTENEAKKFFNEYYAGRSFSDGRRDFLINDMNLSILIPWFRTFEIEMNVDVNIQ